MFKKKILIIEDTEFMKKLISDVLKEAGYEVVTASSGEEGLQKVREEKPDLVLLDVVMPGMDGFEVCRILREDESNNLMPIIMLTAQENEDHKLEGLELGADDYIIKPFNSRELVSRVRNTLKRIDRNRLANPLTGLRGNIEIQAEINQRIAKKEVFAVIYGDLDNFKSYNDVYGFASGDRAIKLTADVLIDATNTFGNSRDFIGHIGGDDFVIITTPDKVDAICENIIKTFDIKIKELYCKEDVDRGYIVTSNRQGQIMKFPLVSISLSVVTNEERELISHLQIAEIAAELKKKAKAMQGSVYVKDRRRG
ncbi:GGDEF domain-containing response regulator [Acetivibrio saccincola]|uniref:GGDEF domain-containing response regulator n=1 Tax=Acetivibrio saccincola TaxID=1677857 RepID=UPI0016A4AA21|nr:response regulator [Acetivibrio saccincola]NLW26904.1 response regulator [Acetivibrio saccincola]HOA96387.1 response regulator [Acetivibrio saccincola]HQD29503.1 response regulator [Acetivibrio saccincola]